MPRIRKGPNRNWSKEEKIRTPEQLFTFIKRQDPDLFGGIGGQIKSETGEDHEREIVSGADGGRTDRSG